MPKKLFQPGVVSNPNGRPVGSKNKFTKLRDDFMVAYEKMGGVEELAKWGEAHPGEYYQILSKLFPKDINFNSEEGFKLIVNYPKSKEPGPKEESKPKDA